MNRPDRPRYRLLPRCQWRSHYEANAFNRRQYRHYYEGSKWEHREPPNWRGAGEGAAWYVLRQ